MNNVKREEKMEQFDITPEEEEKILKNVFSSLEPLKLKVISSKAKKKEVIFRKIAGQFEKDKKYTEMDVNGILKQIYPEDYSTLRRGLIELGYMDRTSNGSEYWLK
jgi:hypothetical protein